ncbi:MAG: hypothetical protein ACAH95_02860 [Fimbriimonas sp.]
MKVISSSNQPRESYWPSRPRSFGGRRNRGATLVTAIFATFGLSLFVGSTALYVSSTYSLAWSRANSEAALLLAEGGVNREMQFISKQMQLMANPRSHSYQTQPGEPYAGYPGTIDGMPGKIWVYTTEPGTTKPWKGSGPAQITCTAVVGGPAYNGQSAGPKVVRTLAVQTTPKSVFSAFAVFGLDGAGNGEQPAIGITGGSKVTVEGNVGSNSRVQGGNGEIGFTRAYNYNAAKNSGNQFAGGSTYSIAAPLVVSTVTEVLLGTIPGKPVSDPWDWLLKNNNNDQIRQYNAIGGTLTNSGTQKVNFSRAPMNMTNKFLGTWTGVNFKPSTTKRVLIFPPGDYYLSDIDVDWDSTTEILIDNAGLTTPQGNNVEGKPVRFWFSGGSKQDNLKLPLYLTNPQDPSTFRLFYGKDGAVFNIIRDPGFPQKQYIISGCVYAVTSKLDPNTGLPVDSTLKGTQIDFFGDSENSGNSNVLYGSLIADRVAFHGICSVIFPSAPMDQEDDPAMGVGYSGTCDREPCYGG